MEYLPLAFAGLLGGGYLICSAAEFLLWLFERGSSGKHCAREAQPMLQEGGRLTSPSTDQPRPIPQPYSPAPGQKPGILIADDHRRYRRLLEAWFRDHGFAVWAAADGREAVRLYQAHAKQISLALLDVDMPRLDGPGTLAALRQDGTSIPCCFMTPNLGSVREAQLLALGAAAVFEKPLLLGETTAAISGLINGRGRLCEEGHPPSGGTRGDP
jgi:CheY-like chemotaxis protein